MDKKTDDEWKIWDNVYCNVHRMLQNTLFQPNNERLQHTIEAQVRGYLDMLVDNTTLFCYDLNFDFHCDPPCMSVELDINSGMGNSDKLHMMDIPINTGLLEECEDDIEKDYPILTATPTISQDMIDAIRAKAIVCVSGSDSLGNQERAELERLREWAKFSAHGVDLASETYGSDFDADLPIVGYKGYTGKELPTDAVKIRNLLPPEPDWGYVYCPYIPIESMKLDIKVPNFVSAYDRAMKVIQ